MEEIISTLRLGRYVPRYPALKRTISEKEERPLTLEAPMLLSLSNRSVLLIRMGRGYDKTSMEEGDASTEEEEEEEESTNTA